MHINRFIDSHIHLWQLDRLRYPWLTPPFFDDGPNGKVEAIARDYLPANYLRDAIGHNVVKTVHIEAGVHPDDALSETRWLQSLANSGLPTAIVACATLNDPGVERLLAAHVESPGVRGIRHILNWHVDPKRTYTSANLLDDPAFARGYALLAKYNLSFDLQIYPNQMAQAAALAARHPDIPVILNHMGMPVDSDTSAWRDGMKQLASLPHVAVKISGMGFIDRQWTEAAMRIPVLETIEVFGTKRCLFASDFPTDKLFNSYGRAMDFYASITKGFSDFERDDLFAANAERVYRI